MSRRRRRAGAWVPSALLALAPARAAGAPLGSAFPQYALTEAYVGEDFFSRWQFWTDADPTGGTVSYVSEEEAESAGLIRATADSVYVGADLETQEGPGDGRRSVRIQSSRTYDAGLFVARIGHMPTGCGTWPAFWMYGEDPEHPWPTHGEYDIIEGVHNADVVMTSLHTSAGCVQSKVRQGRDFTGRWSKGLRPNVKADDCDVSDPDQFGNQGCSQQGPSHSMGAEFNKQGGGTFVAEWDPEGAHFRTWLFTADSEPQDLKDGRPLPDEWGPPYSYYRLDDRTCAPKHFANMRLVFNLDFCGALGDATFRDSCPDIAKTMSCTDYVRNHPEKLQDAYWSIQTLDVYQRPMGPPPPFVVGSTLGGRSGADADRSADRSRWFALGALIAVLGCAGLVAVAVAAVVELQKLDPCDGSAMEGLRRQRGPQHWSFSPLISLCDYMDGNSARAAVADGHPTGPSRAADRERTESGVSAYATGPQASDGERERSRSASASYLLSEITTSGWWPPRPRALSRESAPASQTAL